MDAHARCSVQWVKQCHRSVLYLYVCAGLDLMPAVGGQAAVVKLRPTSEKTPDSLVLESPYNADGLLERERPRWRHMK